MNSYLSIGYGFGIGFWYNPPYHGQYIDLPSMYTLCLGPFTLHWVGKLIKS
jgi:hypothetical protein